MVSAKSFLSILIFSSRNCFITKVIKQILLYIYEWFGISMEQLVLLLLFACNFAFILSNITQVVSPSTI